MRWREFFSEKLCGSVVSMDKHLEASIAKQAEPASMTGHFMPELLMKAALAVEVMAAVAETMAAK